MTSVHLLVSGKKKKKSWFIIWKLLQGQLAIIPGIGYPSLDLFWPLFFLQLFDHLLISPFARREVKGRTKKWNLDQSLTAGGKRSGKGRSWNAFFQRDLGLFLSCFSHTVITYYCWELAKIMFFWKKEKSFACVGKCCCWGWKASSFLHAF